MSSQEQDSVSTVFKAALQHFEAHFFSLSGRNVLASVSGGVDSMTMLFLLDRFRNQFQYNLYAVTVNHNIREEAVSKADADLVAQWCRNREIPCCVKTLEPGSVSRTEKLRQRGTEEAARFLRYNAIESVAKENQCCVIFLAHNRNDRLETLLQRFLQGAAGPSACGMEQARMPYFRPLFDADRQQIEAFALHNAVPFRTDATNFDNSYFRNKIRNRLIPLLNELEPGWDTAVLYGARKRRLEADALSEMADKIFWKRESPGTISAPAADFWPLPDAVKIRILYNGLAFFGTEQRVPYHILESFALTGKTSSGAGVTFYRQNDFIFICSNGVRENHGFLKESSGFCVPVTEEGEYQLPFGTVVVSPCSDGKFTARLKQDTLEQRISGPFRLPAVIRNAVSSDRLRFSNGCTKNVFKLFSEKKADPRFRHRIPVIQDSSDSVTAVWFQAILENI